MFSCGKKGSTLPSNLDSLKTQVSENLVVLSSENGVLASRFETPLMERYELAAEPFMEFRKGIKIESYNDSTREKESDLIADYAKYLETQELWEARGNVVATGKDGKILKTEQLFWDQKQDKVYSNVHSLVIDGEEYTEASYFETNSAFDDYLIRKARGQFSVDTSRNGTDSLSQDPADSLLHNPTDSLPLGTNGPVVDTTAVDISRNEMVDQSVAEITNEESQPDSIR